MRSFFVVLIALLVVLLLAAYLAVPLAAQQTYGDPAPYLGGWQRFQYSATLLWANGLLTRPADPYASERLFAIPPGEQAFQVANRLQQDGFIRDAAAFRAYLIYRGFDTRIQTGEFILSPALTAMQIAERLQDPTPTQVKFTVLPGWRLEEVAASLPTSGLSITPDDFLAAARSPGVAYDFLPPSVSVEGFLLPGQYTVLRGVSADELVNLLVGNFALVLSEELRNSFAAQGLDVYQAVTLASIVQREAVLAEEQPLIASVFYNRLAINMKLESDPTAQYALGYDPLRNGWWPVPLTLADLQVDSPYNTYVYGGLPPGPIASPALSALQAVAFPEQSPYYFFRAACDGSGAHAFAVTFEEHLANGCQ